MERIKEGSISFHSVGHPCTSWLLCSLAAEVELSPPEKERPPSVEKQAAAFEKAARARCCACPLWQCGICSAVSACASPVMLQARGGETYTDDEHYSLSWFCGRAQQFKCCEGVTEVLKTKSLLVTALERGMKKKKKRRREFKCVGEWWWLKFQLAWEIGSHISISTQAFVEVLQLTFMLNEANGNKTGSLACLCPNIWGGTVWKVLLTEDRSFPLPPGMFVLLPQYVVAEAVLSVAF